MRQGDLEASKKGSGGVGWAWPQRWAREARSRASLALESNATIENHKLHVYCFLAWISSFEAKNGRLT